MTINRTPTPVYLDPGMHSGLEVKGLIADDDAFTAVYCNNLSHIYQYDKKEITDYLEACGTAHHLHKDKLLALRLQLYEKICTIFSECADLEMYNRRKIDIISEDVYIIGYSIVNERKDKRLCKVLKSNGQTTNSSQDSNHDSNQDCNKSPSGSQNQ